jgi:transposase-like protein
MGKQRKFTSEFKFKVVLDALQNQKSQAQLAREYNVDDQLISRWRQEFLERAPSLFETHHTHSVEQERIAELERLVGQLTLQLSILKKASSLLPSTSLKNGNW